MTLSKGGTDATARSSPCVEGCVGNSLFQSHAHLPDLLSDLFLLLGPGVRSFTGQLVGFLQVLKSLGPIQVTGFTDDIRHGYSVLTISSARTSDRLGARLPPMGLDGYAAAVQAGVFVVRHGALPLWI